MAVEESEDAGESNKIIRRSQKKKQVKSRAAFVGRRCHKLRKAESVKGVEYHESGVVRRVADVQVEVANNKNLLLGNGDRLQK